jgi:hypothetical protein
VIVGILCAYFALLLALGGHRAWGELGVPAASPGFLDLRSLTSGWDCARNDQGAWPDNPCDPYGRPENYPRIWLAASIFGLGQDDTYVLGSLLAVLFFVSAILVVPRQAPVGVAVVYGVALCSPTVMLGVERGNVDILLFTMIAAAGLVLRRKSYGPPVASALVLAAAVLKLFPIAAIGMLAGLPRRTAAVCISIVGGLFAVYAAATYRDIQTIERVLPQVNEYSYGINMMGAWLGSIVGSGRAWNVALVLAGLAVALALRRRLATRLPAPSARDLDLFWAGAGIYVATFALVRSYDYRLVFLLLTIPLLVRWATARAILPLATAISVLLTLWLPRDWSNVPVVRGAIHRWDELTSSVGATLPTAAPAQLATFVGLTCILVATFPRTSVERSRPDSSTRSATANRVDADEPVSATR